MHPHDHPDSGRPAVLQAMPQLWDHVGRRADPPVAVIGTGGRWGQVCPATASEPGDKATGRAVPRPVLARLAADVGAGVVAMLRERDEAGHHVLIAEVQAAGERRPTAYVWAIAAGDRALAGPPAEVAAYAGEALYAPAGPPPPATTGEPQEPRESTGDPGPDGADGAEGSTVTALALHWLALDTAPRHTALFAIDLADDQSARRAYAAALARALADAGVPASRIEREGGGLRVGGQAIDLPAGVRACLTVPPHARADLVDGHAADIAANVGTELPTRRESAEPRLCADVRGRGEVSAAILADQAAGGAVTRVPAHNLIGDYVALVSAYIWPQVIQALDADSLARWGLTHVDVLGLTRERLRRLRGGTGSGLVATASGLRVVDPTCPAVRHAGLLLLLAGDLGPAVGVEDAVAMPLSRDRLLVAPASNADALGEMAGLARAAVAGGTGGVTPVPLTWRDGRWADWAPRADSPLAAQFAALRRRHLCADYARQASPLRRLLLRRGDPAVVAAYGVAAMGGAEGSYTMWAAGGASLLAAAAEWVAFVDARGTSTVTVYGQAPMPRVRDLLSDMTSEVQGVWPGRLRVAATYPSPSQLDRLRLVDRLGRRLRQPVVMSVSVYQAETARQLAAEADRQRAGQ